MKKIILLSLLCSAMLVSNACAEMPKPREWTSSTGKQVTATFVGMTGDYIQLRSPRDGNVFTVASKYFIEKDQELAQKLAQTLPAPDPKKIAAAINALKSIDASKLSKAEQKIKAKEIEAAWNAIQSAGQVGYDTLLNEVKKMKAAKVKDDRFYLAAGFIFWDLQRQDAVPEILVAWKGTDLKANYAGYVFPLAREAAFTQDPKVEPLLLELLKDNESSFFIHMHALRLEWPLNLEFLFGTYGRAILPALHKRLQTTEDETEKMSAIFLLTESFYLPALPDMRKIAKTGKGPAAGWAIKALGELRHPNESEILMELLDEQDPEKGLFVLHAVYEYGDLRMVKKVIPYLKDKDPKVAAEAAIILLRPLQSAEGIIALNAALPQMHIPERYKARMSSDIDSFCKGLKINRKTDLVEAKTDEIQKSMEAEAKKFLENIKKEIDQKAEAKPEKKLTAKQVEEACADFVKRARTRHGEYSFSEVAEAATPEQFPLLLDARNALYRRYSDECLSEIRGINQTLKRKNAERYLKKLDEK